MKRCRFHIGKGLRALSVDKIIEDEKIGQSMIDVMIYTPKGN